MRMSIVTEKNLIARAQRGDKRAMEKLVNVYAPLAYSLCKKWFLPGYESEDIKQVAMMGLVEAIYYFDPSRSTRLSTFAYRTILKSFEHTSRKMLGSKYDKTNVNSFVVLSDFPNEAEDYLTEMHDTQPDPCDIVVMRSEIAKYAKKISGTQFQALSMLADGYSYQDVKNRFGRSAISLVQHARGKVRLQHAVDTKPEAGISTV